MYGFPRRLYITLGVLHFMLGLLLLILIFAALGVVFETYSPTYYGSGFYLFLIGGPWPLAIFCGVLLLITGMIALGTAWSVDPQTKESLRIAFGILNILLAILFTWISAAQTFASTTNNSDTVLLGLYVVCGVCLVLAWIVAIASALVFCCVSTMDDDWQSDDNSEYYQRRRKEPVYSSYVPRLPPMFRRY